MALFAYPSRLKTAFFDKISAFRGVALRHVLGFIPGIATLHPLGSEQEVLNAAAALIAFDLTFVVNEPALLGQLPELLNSSNFKLQKAIAEVCFLG